MKQDHETLRSASGRGRAAGRLFVVTIAAGLALLQPALGSPAGGENDSGIGAGTQFDTKRLTSIPVVAGSGVRQIRLEVRFIVVKDDIRDLGVDMDLGVRQRNVDKLQFGSVPVLSSLFGNKEKTSDFAPENQVGRVYRDGDRLAVVLNEGQRADAITGITVYNDDFAYQVLGALTALQDNSGGTLAAPRVTTMDSNSATISAGGNVPQQDTQSPSFSKREVETNVQVPDKGTVLIGGLTQGGQSSGEQRQGSVPVLSDIPNLGKLFAKAYKKQDETNLLILIRPAVVAPSEN
jgi:Flp pilus assembly secretin CpaC